MKKLLSALSLYLLLSLAKPAFACEPIVPLVFLFSGTLFIARSLFVLIGAIFIKAIAFALFEKTLPWYKTIEFMLIANIVSSLVGFGLSLEEHFKLVQLAEGVYPTLAFEAGGAFGNAGIVDVGDRTFQSESAVFIPTIIKAVTWSAKIWFGRMS